MKTAVVTGAAGFIGSHLVTRLLRDGYNVRPLDNLSTGTQENFDNAVKEAGGASSPKLLQLDLASADDLAVLVENADYVFHLAALADIVPSIEDPAIYHRNNVEATVRLLTAIQSLEKKPKVIYAASSSCYGVTDLLPTSETAPIRPEYPYALTKNVAEQYVLHWAQVYGMPAISLRFFNVYGPRARTNGTYGAVFGVFLAQKLAGQPMTIVGDGTQTRDFTFVTDVVDACVRAAESNITGEIFNVGAANPQSVNYLCQLLGGPTTHIPKRPGEPDCTWADTSKIQRVLGWSPQVSFEDGVACMLDSIALWAGAPVWTPQSIETATASWFAHLETVEKQHA